MPSPLYSTNQLNLFTNMSPSRIDEPADFWDPVPAKKSIFPDGIKTSGQQEPIYAFVRPYDDFPKHITGPTVWKKEDFLNSAEKWTHRFTEEEIKEISLVADRYIENDFPLTGITKVSTPEDEMQPGLTTHNRTSFRFLYYQLAWKPSRILSSMDKASGCSKVFLCNSGAFENQRLHIWGSVLISATSRARTVVAMSWAT